MILVISQAMRIRTNKTELLFRDERQQKETVILSAKPGSPMTRIQYLVRKSTEPAMTT
jgi:hypothetical protein